MIVSHFLLAGDEKILLQVVDSGLVQNLLDNDGDYYQKSVDIVVLMLGNGEPYFVYIPLSITGTCLFC